MATYTIGYYSPPLPPGAGIEAVTPEYAVDPDVTVETFGGADLPDAFAGDLSERVVQRQGLYDVAGAHVFRVKQLAVAV